jgi:hypothetical protein
MAVQLPITWLSSLAPIPAAALPPLSPVPPPTVLLTPGEASGAPSGRAKPAPNEPSGERRPAAPRAFLNVALPSWARRPAAAFCFCRSTSGMTANG